MGSALPAVTGCGAVKEIVVCGEALVDIVTTSPAPSPGRLAPMQPALGGGPFNVAVTLGRLGSSVSFLSRVSTDHLGDEILRALSASGVGLSMCQRGDEPTTLAVATIGDDGAASYSFYTDGTADRLVADPGPLPGTVGAVCFGTLSMVLEPGVSVYESVMRRAHAEGTLVMIDPNIRPAVIADPDAYRRRFAGWMQYTDIVKVSDEDAAWLAQGSAGTGVRDWLDAGVSAVVMSAGADGLRVTTERLEVSVPAPHVQVVDTIGAGDTVGGALLHWLSAHSALNPSSVADLDASGWQQALGFAAAAAAVTVSRPGADPPWAGEQVTD